MKKSITKKTSIQLIGLLLSILFVSCSKDDAPTTAATTTTVDTLESLKTNFTGKWQYEKRDVINDGVETLIDYTHPCSTKKDNFILKQDNMYDANSFNNSCTEIAMPNLNYFIKITNNGNFFVVDNTFNNKIITLTSTELKFVNDNNEIYLLKKI